MVGEHDNYLSALPNTAVTQSQQQWPNLREIDTYYKNNRTPLKHLQC